MKVGLINRWRCRIDAERMSGYYRFDVFDNQSDNNTNMEENGEKKTLKPWQERVKSSFPDREFAGDEDYDSAAEELIADLSGKTETINKANAKLREVLLSSPETAEFLAMLIEGASVPEALARCFDMDSITPQEGEPDYEKWNSAVGERKKKLEADESFSQELTANKVDSSKVFDQFVAEHGMSEAEADAFLGQIEDVLSMVYRGKVTMDFLNAMYQGVNYEETLAKERNAAKVAGKNEAVELKKESIPKGDGLPKIGSSGDMKEAQKKVPAGGEFFSKLEEKYK